APRTLPCRLGGYAIRTRRRSVTRRRRPLRRSGGPGSLPCNSTRCAGPSRREARMQSRLGWFLKAIAVMSAACAVAAAVACAVGYVWFDKHKPVVHVTPEAAQYARQSLFPDASQMAAFSARLGVLAVETGTSVAVTYVERPRSGESLPAAVARSVKELDEQL